ncbi:Uncharacterised protein [Yersinia similis]|uniref:hypothetical protein n=1 Tax=Yersinia similis TaxID=367190 RepID=UPI0005E316B4|nr:hypothetical protein [Yersinia similis]CNF73297.1 Uncharacterised protein [Yersinia similis]
MIKTAEEFIRLRKSTIPEEYKRAATEEAPISVWIDIIDNYPEMRVWVARNKTIPEKVFFLLSKDNDPIVKSAIASKYPLSLALYESLSKDKEESVRVRLTYNKKLPLDILKYIMEDDPSEFVRVEAASNYKRRTQEI